MGINRFQAMIHHAKHVVQLRRSSSSSFSSSSRFENVPKGHLAVYVGEANSQIKNRFVVPVWYLDHPLFRDLLRSSEEEYGFDYPNGGLTIPCSEDTFKDLTSHLNGLH